MNIKSASMTNVLIALALGFTFAGANVARADSSPETRSITVSLAGLDLSTAAGESAARERVHQAARSVCSRVQDPYALAPPCGLQQLHRSRGEERPAADQGADCPRIEVRREWQVRGGWSRRDERLTTYRQSPSSRRHLRPPGRGVTDRQPSPAGPAPDAARD